MLVIPGNVTNRTVVISYLGEQTYEGIQSSCEWFAEGSRDGVNHFYAAIWNQTGMTHYEQRVVDWTKPLRLEMQLPDDPPYLIWQGMTCFGLAQIEVHAAEWFLTSQHFLNNETRAKDPLVVKRWTEPTVDVVIPAGATRGTSYFPVTGLPFLIELAPSHGTIDRPSAFSFGHFYLFGPSDPPGLDHWQTHVWWDLSEPDGTWYPGYGAVADPGDWRLEVVLDQPALQETVWKVEFDSVWEFDAARMDALGFRMPFADHR